MICIGKIKCKSEKGLLTDVIVPKSLQEMQTNQRNHPFAVLHIIKRPDVKKLKTRVKFTGFLAINIGQLAAIAVSEEIPQAIGPFVLLQHDGICYGALVGFRIQLLNYYRHEAEMT